VVGELRGPLGRAAVAAVVDGHQRGVRPAGAAGVDVDVAGVAEHRNRTLVIWRGGERQLAVVLEAGAAEVAGGLADLLGDGKAGVVVHVNRAVAVVVDEAVDGSYVVVRDEARAEPDVEPEAVFDDGTADFGA